MIVPILQWTSLMPTLQFPNLALSILLSLKVCLNEKDMPDFDPSWQMEQAAWI